MKNTLLRLLSALVILTVLLGLSSCATASGPTFADFKVSEKTRQGSTVVVFDTESKLASRFWISIPAPTKGTSNWTVHNPGKCAVSKLDTAGYTLNNEPITMEDGSTVSTALRLSVDCPTANSPFWFEATRANK